MPQHDLFTGPRRLAPFAGGSTTIRAGGAVPMPIGGTRTPQAFGSPQPFRPGTRSGGAVPMPIGKTAATGGARMVGAPIAMPVGRMTGRPIATPRTALPGVRARATLANLRPILPSSPFRKRGW